MLLTVLEDPFTGKLPLFCTSHAFWVKTDITGLRQSASKLLQHIDTIDVVQQLSSTSSRVVLLIYRALRLKQQRLSKSIHYTIMSNLTR